MLRAYMKAFPNLFAKGDTMPPTLREHLRYPTDLFEVQTSMWGRYHVEDPTVLLENSRRWDVARDPGERPQATASTAATGATGVGSTSSTRAMDAYYTQAALPGETTQSFVITRSFTTASTDNSKLVLTGMMFGKSDGADYGKLVVYNVNGNQALAPSGVMNGISTSTEVSQAITLLNTKGQGSQVLYGDLIAVPVGNSLVHVRSVYLQPEDQRTAALIEKVIVSVGGRVVMADTYPGALDLAFPGTNIGSLVSAQNGSTTTAPGGTSGGTGTGTGSSGGSGTGSGSGTGTAVALTPAQSQRLAEIVAAIAQKRDLANTRFGEGKFTEYAQLQADIDRLLADAQQILTGASAPSPSATGATGSTGSSASGSSGGTTGSSGSSGAPAVGSTGSAGSSGSSGSGSSSGSTGTSSLSNGTLPTTTLTSVTTTTRRLTSA
jgi:uncharacterized membrane protein (UPF0182 family)